jgi:hypothetical protein
MAYLQARSGIARSGVTYAGWTPPKLVVLINGVDRTANVLYGNFSIADRMGAPSTLTFTLKNVTPVDGHDISVTYATPNDFLFAGTVLQIEAQPFRTGSQFLQWTCAAVSYHWLMDRYMLVLASYQSVGVGTMVADILYRNTNGSFRVGSIPSSFGNLDMDFTYETVSGALDRIGKAVGAFWELTPEQVVNFYTTPVEAALPTVTNAPIASVRYGEDLTQVRTRVIYEGGGSTASVTGGTQLPLPTTIAVDDTSMFSTTGGLARSGTNIITYTGTSTSSGPGSLTGCSGQTSDIPQGAPINLIADVADGAAQTALATVLGGGLSGQATYYLQDGRLSQLEANGRAAAELANYGAKLKEVTYLTQYRYVKVGRSVTLSISDPLTISGAFRIQAITISPRTRIEGQTVDLWRYVTGTPMLRTVGDLLRQVKG